MGNKKEDMEDNDQQKGRQEGGQKETEGGQDGHNGQQEGRQKETEGRQKETEGKQKETKGKQKETEQRQNEHIDQQEERQERIQKETERRQDGTPNSICLSRSKADTNRKHWEPLTVCSLGKKETEGRQDGHNDQGRHEGGKTGDKGRQTKGDKPDGRRTR